jgi:hypothetical protein
MKFSSARRPPRSLYRSDVARAPGTIPDAPQVTPPVTLVQLRVLLHQHTRASPLQRLHYIAHRQLLRVAQVHVDMVLTARRPLTTPFKIRISKLLQTCLRISRHLNCTSPLRT